MGWFSLTKPFRKELNERKKSVVAGAKAGMKAALITGTPAVSFLIFKNPSVANAISHFAVMLAAGAATGAKIAAKEHSLQIQKARNVLIANLRANKNSNLALQGMIRRYKYLKVNGKNGLKGTNYYTGQSCIPCSSLR